VQAGAAAQDVAAQMADVGAEQVAPDRAVRRDAGPRAAGPGRRAAG